MLKKPLPAGRPIKYDPNHRLLKDPVAFSSMLLEDRIFGFVCVTILPPSDLLIPVLPCNVNKKVYYSLCFTCAQRELQASCPHDWRLRAFTDTFVVPELVLALKKNYKILAVHSYYEYERINNLFTDFTIENLKDKIKASKIPERFRENPQEYTQLLKEKNNIDITPEEIQPDKALRLSAKYRG